MEAGNAPVEGVLVCGNFRSSIVSGVLEYDLYRSVIVVVAIECP